MAWLKRNLWLVTSVALCVGILGYGGFLLWDGMSADAAAGEELNNTRRQLETLQNSKPFPNQQNLTAAKEQLKQAQTFIDNAIKLFPPTDVPAGLKPETFNSFAETTVSKLQAAMGRQGPTNYSFSFGGVVSKGDFRLESLRPLAEQIAEVKMICDVLFGAGIAELRDVRRMPASQDEPSMGSEYMQTPMAATRHDGGRMEVWPYEVKFTCFSAAFGQVLEGFGRHDHALIVKHVRVEPDFVNQKAAGTVNRATNAPKAMVTLLNEQKLQVTLLIQVVKPARLIQRGPGGR